MGTLTAREKQIDEAVRRTSSPDYSICDGFSYDLILGRCVSVSSDRMEKISDEFSRIAQEQDGG
jgi:hypothetical protein